MENNFEINYVDAMENQVEGNTEDDLSENQSEEEIEEKESDEEKEFKIFKEKMKKKYGSIYVVVNEFEIDDASTKQLKYCLKKPMVSSYDRYVKGMSKGMSKASRIFAMDNIVEEQKNQFINDLEKYPALSIGIAEKLMSMLGYGDVTVKKI